MVCQLCHLKSSVDYRGGYEIVDNGCQSDSESIRFDSVQPIYTLLISYPDEVSEIVTKVGAVSGHVSAQCTITVAMVLNNISSVIYSLVQRKSETMVGMKFCSVTQAECSGVHL